MNKILKCLKSIVISLLIVATVFTIYPETNSYALEGNNAGENDDKSGSSTAYYAWLSRYQGYRFYIVDHHCHPISNIADFWYTMPDSYTNYRTTTRFSGNVSGLTVSTFANLKSLAGASSAPNILVRNGSANGGEFRDWCNTKSSKGNTNLETLLNNASVFKVTGYSSALSAVGEGGCYVVVEPLCRFNIASGSTYSHTATYGSFQNITYDWVNAGGSNTGGFYVSVFKNFINGMVYFGATTAYVNSFNGRYDKEQSATKDMSATEIGGKM